MHIQQVKIPVTDLRRSVAWYATLLGVRLFREFYRPPCSLRPAANT